MMPTTRIIGIDGNEANVEKRVGIGEYAFELLSKFKEYQTSPPISSAKAGIRGPSKFQIYLKDMPLPHMPRESENWKYIIVKPAKLWTQIGLPLYLFTHFPRPDVFFTPSHYAPRFSPVPTVIAVMDLSYEYFPELFARKDLYQLLHWTKHSVKNATKIFTISQSSKNDILKKYAVADEKVVVTYPGIKKISNINPDSIGVKYQMSNFKSIQEKYGVSENYILFVGTIQPRKNISRLIEAFSKLTIKDLQLVIVGKKGWLYGPILAKPKELGIEEHVKFLDFVSDTDLDILYRHALCYCLPSLYEGFGLPVLEAMQKGCPVITSNVSSLPEAGGDACLYVDPLSVSDIAEKLRAMVTDKKLRETYKKKGYTQVKKFSWEKTAKETLEVLEEIAKD